MLIDLLINSVHHI